MAGDTTEGGSAGTVAAETDQGSAHLESLLMTRMRAPFSSFSRWLSDLSSVRIWDSTRKKKKKDIESGSYITAETVYGTNSAMQSMSATETLSAWYVSDRMTSVPLLWKFSVQCGRHALEHSIMQMTLTRWSGREEDVGKVREKQGDQSLKSGSCVSWEAGTKNSTWLKYFPFSRSKQYSAASCSVFTEAGEWADLPNHVKSRALNLKHHNSLIHFLFCSPTWQFRRDRFSG